MAIINQVFVDGAHAVARTVEMQVRQASETVSSSASATLSSIASSATAASSTDSPVFSTTPSDPSPTMGGGGGSQNNNTGTSSPLLFFVALGFGVVFTNLWIIVGVKYCFRYNARNRQMRGGLDENGEPINLENMPTRPHRRRREKKLMTMDEVNEKFPMVKYKTWVAGRAKEGLPTAGGVSAPPSRANSVRSVEGVVPELHDLPSKEKESTEDGPNAGVTSKTSNQDGTSGSGAENGAALTQTQTAGTILTKDPDHAQASDDEDDEHINAALPPELVATSGDTCAICIDTLEDDDDVRGLTCGHAFHAVCLDPWLTNRRACCPLCKADYYTPKPRPPPAEGDPTSPTSPNAVDPARNNSRLNMPRSPQRTFGGWTLRTAPRVVLPSRGGAVTVTTVTAANQNRTSMWDRRRQETNQQSPSNAAQGQQNGPWLSRVRDRLPTFGGIGFGNRTREPTASGANNFSTSPSQLEAGTGAGPTTTATN